MKYAGLICKYMLPLLVVACGQKGSNSQSEKNDEAESNKVLHDQVMEVHDEMMTKMKDLHTLKEQLKEQIAESVDVLPKVKESIEGTIGQLDSANKVMMDWMHQFKPLSDTVNTARAHAYLEDQMEKVERVREDINQALEEAKRKVK